MKNDNEKMSLPFSKPKTLHELLKQGSGHNLVLDFSLLSKRGNLIDKSKKYQNTNAQKISEVINTDKTKISKNFEILSKLGKKKKKIEKINNVPNLELNNNNEKNNLENEIINDFKNKINLTKIETDRNNNINKRNEKMYYDIEYDNPNKIININTIAKMLKKIIIQI